MRIQCSCGKFQADLTGFPKATPGRLMCYCDDCQAYMKYLGRTDLLDASGGTEVIPAYPGEFRIVSGADQMKCTRLSGKGMFRFATKCCNSPICNTRPNSPWAGVLRNMYTAKDPQLLDRTLGDVKARIMGKFAWGPVPAGTPQTMNFKGFVSVLPFMLKGAIGKKGRGSPFFQADGKTPVVNPTVLTAEQRSKL